MMRRWFLWWWPFEDLSVGRVTWPTRSPYYAPPLEPHGPTMPDMLRTIKPTFDPATGKLA